VSPLSKQDGWAALKERIREAAPRLGIDKIGFASADPFTELFDVLHRHRKAGRESGFEEPDLDKRIHPHLSFPGGQPRSIVSIAIAYPSKMEAPPKSEPGAYRGILARSAWGEDYHRVLRERMGRLEGFLKEQVPECRVESMVDKGALVDRAVAERAGIGWYGNNCAVITPEFGSWVYLGEMITDIPFPPDTPVLDSCGDCTICMDACPTGALVGKGELNSSRCISFVTQTKGFVEDDLMRKIGNRLYGCDTCQVVCPKNKGHNWTQNAELAPDPDIAKPLLKPLVHLTNREFKERFGTSAAAWRGKKPIQRNAIIALGNFKDQSAVPDLIKLLRKDDRPVIRGTAAWALGRIGGDEAAAALRHAAEHEVDPEALASVRKAAKI
jgi:epoxyqueuosine reductase